MKTIELDPQFTIPYVRKELRLGKTLAQEVLSLHDLQSGTYSAIAVNDLSRAHDFEAGSVSSQVAAEEVLGQLIVNYLAGSNDNIAIFENTYALPTDQWTPSMSSQISIFNDEVYHYLQEPSDRLNIRDAIRFSGGYPHIGILTSLSTKTSTSFPKALTHSLIRELANSLTYLVVAIYDNESWLLWKRHS